MAEALKGNINAVQRTFQIIEKLSENSSGKGVLQLADETGLPASTAHRILQTLLHAGYVRQSTDTGIYRLTGKMLDIGSRAVIGQDLRAEALPVLRRLREATGESSHLVVLDGNQALTVEAVLSSERCLVDCRVGERVPVHCTAVGKVLTAFRPDVDDFISNIEMPRFTECTICTVAGLRDDLERVRKLGYALDWEENELGIRCIASPIRNADCDVVAAVGISGPSNRVTDAARDELVEKLVHVARDLSQIMGYRL
jgi:DNA-binding IclR family transcriptional regulator